MYNTSHDDCLLELQFAIQEANLIEELDMYQIISEKDNVNVKADQFNNEGHKTNAIDHIKNAINIVLKIIADIASKIGNFLHKAGMSDKEKELYAAYVDACKKDPNFKNKIIRVKDFREQRKAYEKEIGDVNVADKRLAKGEFVDVQRLVNKWSNGLVDSSKAVVKSMTMEAAMNMAKSNIEYAKLIEKQLGEDSKIMQSIRQSLGDVEAEKFKKGIHTYTNRCAGRRFVLKLRGKLFNNVEDCVSDVFSGVESAIKGNKLKTLNSGTASAAARAYRGNDNIKAIGNEAGKIIQGINKGRFDAKMHKATAPARFIGDGLSDATTKLRRKMGDYSDAPLFDIDGEGIVNKQIQHTMNNINKKRGYK
jgi:hypothetical protein